MARPITEKLFFRIGEVAEIVGVKTHILRYWESEFACLRPMKTRGSHRQYRRRDLELTILIRDLLHREGYTIQGAKKRLADEGWSRKDAVLPASVSQEIKARGTLLAVRSDLRDLLKALDAKQAARFSEREQPKEVTVHSAIRVPTVARARSAKRRG